MVENSFFEFKKDLLFKERRLLAEEMRKHDDQINFTRNFCIPTLIGLAGYILTKVKTDSACGNISYEGPTFVLFLPVATILFFAINEGIIQYWKWGAIDRLYKIDKILRESCEEQYINSTRSFEPSVLSEDIRKKLDKQRLNSNGDELSRGSFTNWIKEFFGSINKENLFKFIKGEKGMLISNTIFAWNFGVFYIPLLILSLYLLLWLRFGLGKVCMIIILLGIALSWIILQLYRKHWLESTHH